MYNERNQVKKKKDKKEGSEIQKFERRKNKNARLIHSKQRVQMSLD